MVVVLVCLNGRFCYPGCVGIVSYWHRWRRWVSAYSRFSKRYCQCNFYEILKGRQIIVEPCRNSKYPIKCYDDTKHYQVQSEHRRIQNPFKYLRWNVFAQTVNGLKSLTDYSKTIHLRTLSVLNTPLLKNKASVRCANRTLYAARWNVNLRDICFFTTVRLANVWLCNVRLEFINLRIYLVPLILK